MFRTPPSEITEDERDFGFKELRAPSVDQHSIDADPFYTFVARQISESSYVLKLSNIETGEIYFQRYSYGVMAGKDYSLPHWLPTGKIHSDAGQAIHAAELDLDCHKVYKVVVAPIPREA